jgi:hypothetical protein
MNTDMFQSILSMNIFETVKHTNPIVSGLLSTMIIGLFGYLSQTASTWSFDFCRIYEIFSLVILRKRKNRVKLYGQKEQSFSVYNSNSSIRCNFSDRFNAIWNHVSHSINDNLSIFELTETSNFNDQQNDTIKKDVFIVSQYNQFTLDKTRRIFAKTSVCNDTTSSEKKQTNIDKYCVEIYSYHVTLNELVSYIDELTQTFIKTIENGRQFKQFCYTLLAIKKDDSRFDRWSEVEFNTTRNFDNIFFQEKVKCLKYIDFFRHQKEWYYKNGIQYSMGVGLHGEPGTGKTSFIKCLATLTKRHIITISLKVVKTKQQLEEIFFENTYSWLNRKAAIPFDNKIIVFEDIDCMGDIVLARNKLTPDIELNIAKNNEDTEPNHTSKLLESLKLPIGEDPITLDDLLNILDGVRETPGRIIIITSNHYDKLDPALIRPGRIDQTIHMQNVSYPILQEMSQYYFGKKIKKKDLEDIHEFFYSPAEIINLYVSFTSDHKGFIARLQQNIHV